MSTVESSEQPSASRTQSSRRAPTLRERRINALKKKGIDEQHRLMLEAPTRSFYWILGIISLFVLLGVIMVLSSSSVVRIQEGASAWAMFSRQLVWVLLGFLAAMYTYLTPYHSWVRGRWLLPLAGAAVALNLAVIVRGALVNGARAWLDMFGFRFQPSEFMKIVVILFAANLIATRHRSVRIPQMVFVPLLVAMGVTGLLCAAQKDFGGALIFMGVVLMMMTFSGMPKRFIAATMALVGFFGFLVLEFSRRASLRMLAFMNLEETKEDWGYQVYQSLLSIANGGWTGTGIGSGTSKWGYVPEAHTDFIFAVIAEEMGIAGTIVVIGGFLLLMFFGVQVALAAPDMTGALIAAGVTTWFVFQAFVNIGGVTGALPLTGLTLPFLSYGGSSMIASMAGAGLLLNVARRMKS